MKHDIDLNCLKYSPIWWIVENIEVYIILKCLKRQECFSAKVVLSSWHIYHNNIYDRQKIYLDLYSFKLNII